jgi:hypothetical protein
MWLNLYLGKLLLDKREVSFEEMETFKERERYLERLAAEMYEDNIYDIRASGEVPSIFIHQESNMNKSWFIGDTWREIIETVGSDQARENVDAIIHQLNGTKGFIEL